MLFFPLNYRKVFFSLNLVAKSCDEVHWCYQILVSTNICRFADKQYCQECPESVEPERTILWCLQIIMC